VISGLSPGMRNRIGGRIAGMAALGAVFCLLALTHVISGCGPSQPMPQGDSSWLGTAAETAALDQGEVSSGSKTNVEYGHPLAVTYDELDLDDSWSARTVTGFITLAGNAVRFDGSGACVSGRKVTIST